MVNNINNLCDLHIDSIYNTNLRSIKFNFDDIKSEKIKNISKFIWELLLPTNSDYGIIDFFHKKDIIRKCPLYSIVWQNDEYIVGHRLTTIMELNGYSKELKKLYIYNPSVFNKLVIMFELNNNIKINNDDLDEIHSSSINSDDF